MVIRKLLFVFSLAAIFASFFVISRWDALQVQAQSSWAFEETFEGNPDNPSQDLLPRSLDYVVTHRRDSGGILVDHNYGTFVMDHGMNCMGPMPNMPSSTVQHYGTTSHLTNGSDSIDESFFMCRDHMMSAMGQVSGYSVSSFYPKQEFNFADGGVLEFDVNINTGHPRSWWEIMIVPREELKVGAAIDWLPISETYPKDRIVFRYDNDTRAIEVGEGAVSPNGKYGGGSDWRNYGNINPNDPARTDRTIRRKMRIELTDTKITWYIQTQYNTLSEVPSNYQGYKNFVQLENGVFDVYSANISHLPIDQGIVVFKTHSYTPQKDGNNNIYTFHWDNIRFDGPVAGKFETFEAKGSDVVKLHANGPVEIGTQQSVTINLPYVKNDAVLFGQVLDPIRGQVLVSINGNPNIMVEPIDYGSNPDSCFSGDWKSFYVPIDSSLLKPGENTFTWTVGPRNCSQAPSWQPNGYAVKSLEIQFDSDSAGSTPAPSGGFGSINSDLNADTKVDAEDYQIFLNYFQTQNSKADINGDTVVSIKDFNILVRNYGK